MSRTRKWAYVAQDATRLARLGLSPLEIAKKLGVNKSTVTRWIQDGRLVRGPARPKPEVELAVKVEGLEPAEWAADVRSEYKLSATDEQLVEAGQRALEMMKNPLKGEALQLKAIATFQSVVRQLDLPSRHAPVDLGTTSAPSEVPKLSAPRELPKRTGSDPRAVLMAVK